MPVFRKLSKFTGLRVTETQMLSFFDLRHVLINSEIKKDYSKIRRGKVTSKKFLFLFLKSMFLNMNRLNKAISQITMIIIIIILVCIQVN